MMRNAFRLILRDLVGDNRQPTIQLHRITIDNLAIILSRDLYSQLPDVVSKMKHDQTNEFYIRLASPCRTDDGD